VSWHTAIFWCNAYGWWHWTLGLSYKPPIQNQKIVAVFYLYLERVQKIFLGIARHHFETALTIATMSVLCAGDQGGQAWQVNKPVMQELNRLRSYM